MPPVTQVADAKKGDPPCLMVARHIAMQAGRCRASPACEARHCCITRTFALGPASASELQPGRQTHTGACHTALPTPSPAEPLALPTSRAEEEGLGWPATAATLPLLPTSSCSAVLGPRRSRLLPHGARLPCQ